MSKSYFQNFPTIKYLGYSATDIISNAKLINKYINIPYVYYKMYLDKDQRPDQVADRYYDDPYYSWLVFYANKTIDPYYDWTQTDSDFDKSMVIKYGSIEFSKKKILFFRTNWYNDDREIKPSDFTNRFGTYTSPHSNYWNPKYNADSGALVSYVRKINDTIVHTNKLLKIQVSNNSVANTSKFSTGDLVDIKLGVNVVGTAEVTKANTSVIYLEKQLGEIANTYTVHKDSNTNIYCTADEIKSSYSDGDTSWTKVNLSDDIYIYWQPVYAYDYENELNELKRNINLVDNDLAFSVFDKLRESMEQ